MAPLPFGRNAHARSSGSLAPANSFCASGKNRCAAWFPTHSWRFGANPLADRKQLREGTDLARQVPV